VNRNMFVTYFWAECGLAGLAWHSSERVSNRCTCNMLTLAFLRTFVGAIDPQLSSNCDQNSCHTSFDRDSHRGKAAGASWLLINSYVALRLKIHQGHCG
jgi:hypothetical protein